jgi:drug/metabolite transporter (DMT)-like permease
MGLAHQSAWLVVVSVISGLGFAVLGVSWRLGQAKGVPPTHVAVVISVIGTAFFAGRAGGFAAPALVWALGVAAGVTQYAAIKLIKPALARGPLSPLWCAISLGFVVTVTYARLFLGESLRPLQSLGVAAGVGCVIVASMGQQQSSDDSAPAAPGLVGPKAVYGAILLLILLSASGAALMIKHLSAQPYGVGESYMAHFGDVFYGQFYAVFGLLIGLDLLLTRPRGVPLKPALAVGVLGAAGSVTGLWAWGVASVLPAAVVFTVSSLVSIVAASLASVAFFGEKRTRSWYAAIGLAVVSVVLVSA